MSFYICHCGNVPEKHNFRHPYEKIAEVKVEIDDDNNETFIIDALDFPLKTKEKCGTQDCSSRAEIHGTDILGHPYNPVSYNYREIKLSLPLDTYCHYNKCVQLGVHNQVITHHFKTKVTVKNKGENDIVSVINPEDDEIKINS